MGFPILVRCYLYIESWPRGPFYQHGLILMRACISNHVTSKVWDEFTDPSQNFNNATSEVWEWISNFIPHFKMDVITYPCWHLSQTILVNQAPDYTLFFIMSFSMCRAFISCIRLLILFSPRGCSSSKVLKVCFRPWKIQTTDNCLASLKYVLKLGKLQIFNLWHFKFQCKDPVFLLLWPPKEHLDKSDWHRLPSAGSNSRDPPFRQQGSTLRVVRSSNPT